MRSTRLGTLLFDHRGDRGSEGNQNFADNSRECRSLTLAQGGGPFRTLKRATGKRSAPVL
jgi:hypothetical protein